MTNMYVAFVFVVSITLTCLFLLQRAVLPICAGGWDRKEASVVGLGQGSLGCSWGRRVWSATRMVSHAMHARQDVVIRVMLVLI
ncbi:hypothetical protein V8C86DRAFT_2617234, partial [Haematococcus lacustris]